MRRQKRVRTLKPVPIRPMIEADKSIREIPELILLSVGSRSENRSELVTLVKKK